MKTQTKIENLKKLVAKCDAQRHEARCANELSQCVEHVRKSPSADMMPDVLTAAQTSYKYAVEKSDAFKALKPEWRTLAEQTKLKSESIALFAAKMGGRYSGLTECLVEWRDKTSAQTITFKGSLYSAACKFSRTDAKHIVHICPADVVLLAENEEAIRISAQDLLQLISLREDSSCDWVQSSGKSIKMVSGWFMCADGIGYHSTVSADHCKKGLARKIIIHKKAILRAKLEIKAERRARLVARLCCNLKATIQDAKNMGYCQAGIEQFKAQFNIGDIASLPELVRTGNPAATALAFKIARMA
jgi:hypothetical protein